MGGDAETFDIYVVLKPFRQVVPELRVLLRPFRSPNAAMESVEGYYSPALDSALIALRFEPVTANAYGHRELRKHVGKLGLPMIIPEELTFEKRCAFFLDHLSLYTTYVQQFSSDVGDGSMLISAVNALAAHQVDPERRLFHTPAPSFSAAH